MPKQIPCLWFDGQAEQAAQHYTSIFPNSSIGHLSRYTDAGPGEPGTVMAGEFTIDGMTFRGINGGAAPFGFSEAVSFSVACSDQTEVDYYWDALVDGGEESVCGWLKDRYGLSWQIVPDRLTELLSDPDQERSQRAMQAMLQMKKLDIAELKRAFEGETAGRR